VNLERASEVRVIVVYRNRLLRDLAVSLLRTAPVNLVACVEADSLFPDALDTLQPSVIILDHAATQGTASSAISDLFLCASHGIIRLVVIGLEETRMVVVQRQVMDAFDGEQFIASTLGTGSTDRSALAHFR